MKVRNVLGLALVMGMMSGVGYGAEDALPPVPPMADPPTITTGVREQTFAGRTYMYKETDTTRTGVGDFAQKTMGELMELMKTGAMHPTGSPIFIYQGMGADPAQPFHLMVGFVVADGTKEVAGFSVKKLEDFHCATVIYSGAFSRMRTAYGALFRGMPTRGFVPSGETREYYLLYESQDSPNNVVLIGSGIKGGAATP